MNLFALEPTALPWRARLALEAFRLRFRLDSLLWPERAARRFERLWFTPPHPRLSSDARQWLPRAETLDVRLGGRRIAAWSWGEGPVALLVHGWGGYGLQLHAYIEPLLQAGYRVVSFDALQHGQSEPGRRGDGLSSVVEAADSLKAVAKAVGGVDVLIAHSFGAVASGLAMDSGLRVNRVAFVAPGTSARSLESRVAPMLGVGRIARQRMQARSATWIGRPWSEIDLLALAPRLSGTPLMIVHDLDDRELPLAGAVQLSEAWRGSRLVVSRGLGHRRILRETGVVDQLVKHLGPAAARLHRTAA